MNHHTVVPSLPAADFESLHTLAIAIASVASEIQIDLVDGQFVPLRSWPFTLVHEPQAVVTELQKIATLPESLGREFDCMVKNPEQYLDTLVALKAKRIIIHYGSTQAYNACIAHARTHGYHIGIAFLPTLDAETAIVAARDFDYIQVMGIKEVGKQGQPFAPEALALIAALLVAYPEKEIAVDGAVNADTIPALITAGATRLAPGSAIAKADNPALAYQALLALSEQSTHS